MPIQSGSKAKAQKLRRSKDNDLEGPQDMGGKQGGQADFPKPTQRPQSTERDEDVMPKRGGREFRRQAE